MHKVHNSLVCVYGWHSKERVTCKREEGPPDARLLGPGLKGKGNLGARELHAGNSIDVYFPGKAKGNTANLASERERQLTTARANQTTGFTIV